MELSAQEAKQTLHDIDDVMARTRRVVTAGHSAPLFVLWGFIWFLGFGASQFWPDRQGLVWLALDVPGIAGTIWFMIRSGRPTKNRLAVRILYFSGVLAVFAVVWAFLLAPFNTARLGAYIVTVIMFGYVALGHWLHRAFTILGVAVTAMIVLGAVLWPEWLNLWTGVMGGGALVAAGVTLRWWSRPASAEQEPGP